LNFTEASLSQAAAALQRLRDFQDRLEREEGAPATAPEITQLIADARQAFEQACDDDLNVPKALGHLFDFVREMNQALDDEVVNQQEIEATKELLKEVDAVLGLLAPKQEPVPDEVIGLVKEREEARKRKDYAAADQIRLRLLSLGYVLEDLREGTKVKKAAKAGPLQTEGG
jgi:cysteinyl-tRNA synthetase